MENDVYLILMEDLAGCRFVDQVHGASIEDTISVVSALAHMHAEYWQNPVLRERGLGSFEDFARIYPCAWRIGSHYKIADQILAL